MNRFLLTAAVGLVAVSALAQPNILLVYTDDQRADDLEYMPEVAARIAGAGVSFSRFSATTPMCGPSRASLLRGQYAHNHGMIGHKNWPEGAYTRWVETGLGQQTLGTWLQAVGYRTAFVGKHQTVYPMIDDRDYVEPGWDEWLVPYTRFTDGTYFGGTFNDNGTARQTGPTEYRTDIEGLRLVEFVERSLNDETPFFAVFAPPAPHADRGYKVDGVPYVGLPKPAARHANLLAGLPGPRWPSYDEAEASDKPPGVQVHDPISPHHEARIDSVWQARTESLMAVDEWVGTLLDLLASRDALDNTYVVFASDNGFMLGEHRLPPEVKSSVPYRETVRMPLYIRGPGIPAGTVRDEVTANIDLAPTLLEWAGAPIPDLIDGRSLAPLAAGEPVPDWRTVTLTERWNSGSIPSYVQLVGDEWSFTDWLGYGFTEVYDHVADPFELENAAGDIQGELLRAYGEGAAALATCAGASCREADRFTLPPLVSIVVDGPRGAQYFGPPASGVLVDDLATQNLVRGVPGYYEGSQNPTLFTRYDAATGDWVPSLGRGEVLELGRAFRWYIHDIEGVGGPAISQSHAMPFVLSSARPPETGPVRVLLATDGDRMNYLANPFAVPLPIADVASWPGGWGLVGPLYVYDPDARSWELAPDVIAPWTAFRVRARGPRANGNPRFVDIPYPSGEPARTVAAPPAPVLAFRLDGTDREGRPLADGAFAVSFDGASAGFDLDEDAPKTVPPSPDYVVIGGVHDGRETLVGYDARPAGASSLVLAIEARGAAPDLTLQWDPAGLPDGLSAVLVDLQTGAEVDLRAARSYRFAHASRPALDAVLARDVALAADASDRFVLRFGDAMPDRDEASRLSLSAPTPNPSSGGARLSFGLPEAGPVHLSVLDARGRTVAVLRDGALAAGRHTAALPEALAAGVYVVRLRAGGAVLSRQSVVVR